MDVPAGNEPGGVRLASAQGRWVLTTTVLGSGMAMLDSTVVNVALPRIGADLDADLAVLQWTVTAYMLTLSALILLGGSLGDRYGRRRIFVIGVVWFAAASLLCGLAPGPTVLITARALQGVGGALLTPGSLALIQAVFHPDDRARAVGAWSGLGGVAAAIGPFVGGWLLAGDRVPSWAVVHMLATIFGGQASELRMLWESTQGGAQPPRQTVKGAAQRLQDAFRGLYLAAFCPDLEDVTIEGQVSAATVAEVLRGNVVPDWETTGALVAKLGGHPGDFRRLWEEFHYAFLASQVHFPPDGLSRWVLPGSDPDARGSSA